MNTRRLAETSLQSPVEVANIKKGDIIISRYGDMMLVTGIVVSANRKTYSVHVYNFTAGKKDGYSGLEMQDGQIGWKESDGSFQVFPALGKLIRL